MLHLTFVLFSVGEGNDCPLRRQGVVDEGSVVRASVREDRLAESLEVVLVMLAHVEDTIRHIIEPVSPTSMHPVVHEKAVVDVRRLEH